MRALALLVMLLATGAWAQPYPVASCLRDPVVVELRYKDAAGGTAHLSTVPQPGKFVLWNLAAERYQHGEPCWKSEGACEVAAISVRTAWNVSAGVRQNFTPWWCKTDNRNECPMPAFAPVSVPAGQFLCLDFDRVLGQWAEAPRACTTPPPPDEQPEC